MRLCLLDVIMIYDPSTQRIEISPIPLPPNQFDVEIASISPALDLPPASDTDFDSTMNPEPPPETSLRRNPRDVHARPVEMSQIIIFSV